MGNRIIKFRAFAPHLKEMIQPCFLELFSDGSFNVGRPGEGYNTIRDKEDETILMQFTGKIEDELEIWEGGIYTAEFKTKHSITSVVGVVVMDEYMWCLKCTNDEIYSINRLFGFVELGNVHEHPHLIHQTTDLL